MTLGKHGLEGAIQNQRLGGDTTAENESNNDSEDIKTFKDLVKEVHEPGFCGSCGGCVSFCSAGELLAIGFSEDGRPGYIDEDSCLECGICYLICPQIDALDQDVKDDFNWMEPIGRFERVVSARSTNPEILEVCTDGGAVTAILHCLLERHMIDGAVVSRKTSQFDREPMVATAYEEILEASGSRFNGASGVEELSIFSTYSPTMFAIKEIKKLDLIKIAVVGTPCQIHTLRKMQNLSVVPSHVVNTVLGLFCAESFSFDASKREEVEKALDAHLDDIKKMNLKENFIIVLKEGETKHIPLEKMNPYIRPACLACTDFANDFADISFGGLGSPEGWTTVVIRTDRGNAVYSEAIHHGYIEEINENNEDFDSHSSPDIILKMKKFAEKKNRRGLETKLRARKGGSD